MNASEPKELRVVSCLPFGDEPRSTFALPLLADPTRPYARLMQEVDEYTNLIRNFKIIEGDTSQAIKIDDGPVSRVGNQLVYVFLTEDGTPFAGTVADIEATLRSFASRHPNRTAIALQIMELVGNVDEQRSMRTQMRRAILNRSGIAAAHSFYEGSALRSTLWSRLISAAPNADAADRILSARTKIGLFVTAAGNVRLDLSMLDPRDYAGTTCDILISELESELNFVDSVADTVKDDAIEAAVLDEPQEEAVRHTVDRIKRSGRQEERLCIILDQIIQDRKVGLKVLEIYTTDRAKYARATINDLREALRAETPKARLSDLVLVEIMQRLFWRSMPNSRAALLYYMVKHLAKHPNIKIYLKRRWAKSYSYALKPYHQEIETLLR